ncbi:MAG: nucleotidyltransferase family protein, partial [Mariprofundaceae bacterium]
AVCNADVLTDVDVQMLARMCPNKGCSIALVPNPKHHLKGDFVLQAGVVKDDGDNRHTFSGVSVWDDAALEAYPIDQSFSLVEPMRDLMALDLCRGILHRGEWFDIGRPRDLVRANQLIVK